MEITAVKCQFIVASKTSRHIIIIIITQNYHRCPLKTSLSPSVGSWVSFHLHLGFIWRQTEKKIRVYYGCNSPVFRFIFASTVAGLIPFLVNHLSNAMVLPIVVRKMLLGLCTNKERIFSAFILYILYNIICLLCAWPNNCYDAAEKKFEILKNQNNQTTRRRWRKKRIEFCSSKYNPSPR